MSLIDSSRAVRVTSNSIIGLALSPGCHAPSVISLKDHVRRVRGIRTSMTFRRSPGKAVMAITARSSSFRTTPGSGADRAGGPVLLPTIRRPQAGSGNRPIEEGAVAPFPRGTPRPARPPALRAPLDSRPPRSGGLRRHYDGPLAAATASRRPTDRHRPPPLPQSPGPVGAQAGSNGRGQRQLDSPSGPDPCRFPGRCRRRDLGDRCLGAAPFWRPGAHRSWLWQLPSPRAWARQLSAPPRATGTAGSWDRDRRTLPPSPQSARSGSGPGSPRRSLAAIGQEHRDCAPENPHGSAIDRLVTIRTESEEYAKRVGLQMPEGGAPPAEGNCAHRTVFIKAMRAYNGGVG